VAGRGGSVPIALSALLGSERPCRCGRRGPNLSLRRPLQLYHCPTHRTSLYRRSADHRPRTLTQGLLSSSPWLLNTQQPLAAEPHPAAAAVSHRSSAHEHASRRFLPSDLVLGSTAAKLNRRKTFGEAPGLVLNWLYVHIMTRLRHMCKTSCKLTAASVRQLATLYSYCTRTGTGTRVRTVVRVRGTAVGRACARVPLLRLAGCCCTCTVAATAAQTPPCHWGPCRRCMAGRGSWAVRSGLRPPVVPRRHHGG
jgi:hypothetical protein